MKDLIIIGDGGHAEVLIEIARLIGRRICGLTSLTHSEGDEVAGIPVLGNDSVLEAMNPVDVALVNGLGSVDINSNKTRTHLFDKLKVLGFQFASLIHPSAIISDNAFFHEGVQVMAGCVIQTGVTVGSNSILNTRSVIEHHSTVSANVHVAPGVMVCGAVSIGDGTHIGAGATLIQGLEIGPQSMVAAGAVVVKNVESGCQVKGVPAYVYGT